MPRVGCRVLVFALFCTAFAAIAAEPLKQVGTIPLTGVRGRIDHMSADVAHHRLFVAALGNNSVEVIDTEARRLVRSLGDLKAPQGVLYLPATGRLVVACRDDGSIRVFDANTFQQITSINVVNDADNLRYDARHKALVAGYADGAIGFFDEKTLKKTGEVRLEGHPESFQLEKNRGRMFVNTPTSSNVQVIDTDIKRITRNWPLSGDTANYAMTLDEADDRLFIATRRPPKLIVLDTRTGLRVDDRRTVGDVDDVFYDSARKRIYISGGDGNIDVVSQTSKDKYDPLAVIPTVRGARTSLFVPEWNQLFLAVPARQGQAAEIRVYDVQ